MSQANGESKVDPLGSTYSETDERRVNNKDLRKLKGLIDKPNIGDLIDDNDDEFEELISGVDYIEGELEIIKEALTDMRAQIIKLRRKYGNFKEEGKSKPKKDTTKNKDLSLNPGDSIDDDELSKVLKLSLEHQ